MTFGTFGVRTVLVAAASAGMLAIAPGANAVAPTSATVSFDCGIYGSGTATLTASSSGTTGTIRITTDALTAPFDVSAGDASSTLTLTKNGSESVTFTGNANPAIPSGGAIDSGPLTGTVAAGDSLEAASLKVSVSIITVNCTVTSPQDPGPFVF